METNGKCDFTMKDLISEKYKHMLWQDELGDDFLLLKYAEVFRYSKNVIRLHIWSPKMLSLLRQKGWILNERHPDEPFSIIDVDIVNLEAIIQLGLFGRRPDLSGSWIKKQEEALAHKIELYRTKYDK